MYQEIKPSKGLDDLIDSFWTFSKNKASENFKVLPDTCVDLIFDLNQNKGFLSEVMTSYQRMDLRYTQKLLGHNNSKTTEIYTKVSVQEIGKISTSLDDFYTAKSSTIYSIRQIGLKLKNIKHE